MIEGVPSKHSLIHGYVLHGEQWMNRDPRIRNRPLLCFYPTGLIGQVFRELLLTASSAADRRRGPARGSLASYGVVGQAFTYFEIDPAVAGSRQPAVTSPSSETVPRTAVS